MIRSPRTSSPAGKRANVVAWLLCIATPALAQEQPEEVVVLGTRPVAEHSEEEPSVASTVIRGKDLQGSGDQITDILEQVPGVQTSRRGAHGATATASIRGADAKQVPVYLAGIRLNDDVSGTADLSLVPPHMLSRIEVYRGNAPAKADRLGLGGAIFLEPRSAKGNQLSAGAALGSFQERRVWADGMSGNHWATSLISVQRRQAKNDYEFVNDHGQRFDRNETIDTRGNADFSETDIWAIGNFRLGTRAKVHTVLNGFSREQGIPGLPNVGVDHARSETRRSLAGLSAELPCRFGQNCRINLASAWIHATTTVRDPLIELRGLRTRILHNSGSRWSQDFRLAVDAGRRWHLKASTHLSLSRLQITRLRNLPREGERHSLALRAQAIYDVTPSLSVNALGSLECHTTRGVSIRFNRPIPTDSGRCGIREPVGRVGAQVWLTHELQVLANVARYVRPPTLAELYGTSAFTDGNPQLEVESGATADLGLRLETTVGARLALGLDAFIFGREAKNLVRYRRVNLQSTAPFNVAKARILGVETAGGVEAFNHLKARLSATLLDPRETTGDPALDPTKNDLLPFTSRLTLAAHVEVFTRQAVEALALTRLSLSASYYRKSSRFADSAGLTVLPEQQLVDIEATSDHFAGQLLARASVRNVLDTPTQDLIGLPIPGRSYHVSLEASY